MSNPSLPVLLDKLADDFHGLIRGIVEHLDLQLLFRIDHRTGGIDQATDHIDLVVDGELDRDHRVLAQSRRQGRCLVDRYFR